MASDEVIELDMDNEDTKRENPETSCVDIIEIEDDRRKFHRAERNKYSLEEKMALGELCKKYKKEFDQISLENAHSIKFNAKKRKFTQVIAPSGWASRAVREFYFDLKDVPNSDPKFRSAKSLAERCYKMVTSSNRNPVPSKSKFRQPGGGRRVKAPEVRLALYSWFIDMMKSNLKAHLPIHLFRNQAQYLYDEWLSQQPGAINEAQRMKFSRTWIKTWMRDFNVSLTKPNQRYSLQYEDCEERIPKFKEEPEDERSELLDCESGGIPHDIILSDSDHDDHDDVDHNSTETFHKQITENSNTDHDSQAIMSELCTENSELKNDARFLDELQQLLNKYENSISFQFQPDMMCFKQVNSKARQNFQKHCSKI